MNEQRRRITDQSRKSQLEAVLGIKGAREMSSSASERRNWGDRAGGDLDSHRQTLGRNHPWPRVSQHRLAQLAASTWQRGRFPARRLRDGKSLCHRGDEFYFSYHILPYGSIHQRLGKWKVTQRHQPAACITTATRSLPGWMIPPRKDKGGTRTRDNHATFPSQ